MSTRLIRLDDGTLIEVEASPNEVQQVSSRAADRVHESLASIQPLLIGACRPVIAAWRELNREMTIDQAEIELGLSFEGEGNIYITKAKAGANLTIKLIFKASDQPNA